MSWKIALTVFSPIVDPTTGEHAVLSQTPFGKVYNDIMGAIMVVDKLNEVLKQEACDCICPCRVERIYVNAAEFTNDFLKDLYLAEACENYDPRPILGVKHFVEGNQCFAIDCVHKIPNASYNEVRFAIMQIP